MKKYLESYFNNLPPQYNWSTDQVTLKVIDELLTEKINFSQFLKIIENFKNNNNLEIETILYIPYYHKKIYHHYNKKALNITGSFWEVLYNVSPEENKEEVLKLINHHSSNKHSFFMNKFHHFYLNEVMNGRDFSGLKKIKYLKNINISFDTKNFLYSCFYENNFNFNKTYELMELTIQNSNYFNEKKEIEIKAFFKTLIEEYNINVQEFFLKIDEKYHKYLSKTLTTSLIFALSSYEYGKLYPMQMKFLSNCFDIYKNHDFLHEKLLLDDLEKNNLGFYSKFNFLAKNFPDKEYSLMGLLYVSNLHKLLKELVETHQFWDTDLKNGIKNENLPFITQGYYGLNMLDKFNIDYINKKFCNIEQNLNVLDILVGLYQEIEDKKQKNNKETEKERNKILTACKKLLNKDPDLFNEDSAWNKKMFASMKDPSFKNELEKMVLEAKNLNLEKKNAIIL